MVFKLIEAASERWRYIDSPHLVALVRTGVKSEKGVLVEWPDETEMKDAAMIKQDTPFTTLDRSSIH